MPPASYFVTWCLRVIANLTPTSVLAYSEPSNGFAIIQYTNVLRTGITQQLGQFQIYLFSNGDIGYIYNSIYGHPYSKGGDAAIGKRGDGTAQLCARMACMRHQCNCRSAVFGGVKVISECCMDARSYFCTKVADLDRTMFSMRLGRHTILVVHLDSCYAT